MRRHQPDLVAKRHKLAHPVMRRGARLDPDKAVRLLLEQVQQLTAGELAPQNNLALRVDTLNLENRLGRIPPNNR